MGNNIFKGILKKELFISDILIESLKKYGAIKWHKNKNHSFYIKFRDVRLGSIRIANHKGRDKYHYTYEIFKDDEDLERKINDTIEEIKAKSESIQGFDPHKFVVFDVQERKYKEVKDLNEYKDHIFKK